MPAVLQPAEEHGVVGGLVPQRGGLAQHNPAVGDQHLVARIDPQQKGIGPAGHRRVDVGAQRVGAVGTDTGQQRHIAQLRRTSTVRSSLGFRAADVQQPVAEFERVDLRVVDAQQLPPRTTPSTMSGLCRGEPPTSLVSTSRSAMANPGIRRQQVFHHLDNARRLYGYAQQPARGLGGHHGRVGAGLLQQVLVLGFPDRGDDLGVGCQLARGEGDEDGGVVAVGGDDDRLGVLGAGQPQHLGVGCAAADGDQAALLARSSAAGSSSTTTMSAGATSSPTIAATAVLPLVP